MDWLRIGAFQLLILYHVALAFAPWAFEIKVSPPIDWVKAPMLLTTPWRLALLFLISGYASAALFARDRNVGGFIRSRISRLGLPLLFGIAVLVTPQPWIALVTQHGYTDSFVTFLARDYLRFTSIDGVPVPSWMHLWFVAYLLVYTLVLGALLVLPDRWRGAMRRGVERVLAGPLLLPLPMLYVGLARSLLPYVWIDSHALVDDWSAHAVYLPIFLLGYLLRGSPPLSTAIERWWKLGGALAILAWGVTAGFELAFPGNAPMPPQYWVPLRALRAIQMWGAIVGLIGIAERYLDRDHPWRATLAEAVFPFYIIHQTIILVVGYWLLPTDTSTLARFLILLTATAGGCWLFYLVGRTIPPLRPLIGLKLHRARAAAPQQSAIA